MVNERSLDDIFHAFADSTRRAILVEIARGNPTVGELGTPFSMSAPAISKHLKVLERAGLVTRIREGKVNRFRLNPNCLEAAGEFSDNLSSLWRKRPVKVSATSVSVEEEVLEDYLL